MKNTDGMTEAELKAELAELEVVAFKGEMTPVGARRMSEIKAALANIRTAQSRW